jgi:hypothetical protein
VTLLDFGSGPFTTPTQYAGAVRVEFTMRGLVVVGALIGIGAVVWVVLIGPVALGLVAPRS